MHRLHTELGVHRAPVVGLALVAALLDHGSHTVDLFTMSPREDVELPHRRTGRTLWQGEAFRLQQFLKSGRPACIDDWSVVSQLTVLC